MKVISGRKESRLTCVSKRREKERKNVVGSGDRSEEGRRNGGGGGSSLCVRVTWGKT